jgi:hypothetical protein
VPVLRSRRATHRPHHRCCPDLTCSAIETHGGADFRSEELGEGHVEIGDFCLCRKGGQENGGLTGSLESQGSSLQEPLFS